MEIDAVVYMGKGFNLITQWLFMTIKISNQKSRIHQYFQLVPNVGCINGVIGRPFIIFIDYIYLMYVW